MIIPDNMKSVVLLVNNTQMLVDNVTGIAYLNGNSNLQAGGSYDFVIELFCRVQKGDPPNLKLCEPGEWNVRMLVETVLSMVTTVAHFKKMAHRVWGYFQAHIAFAMVAFYLLVQRNGLEPDQNGFVHLSSAGFSL